MTARLVCWKCGAPLTDIGRIMRLTLCPACRADLHVCRLCRHYDRQALGECRHERAERILEKELANFCTHFRPRPDAWQPRAHSGADEARAGLNALFGTPASAAPAPEEAPVPEPSPAEPLSAAEKARQELDNLFKKDTPDA